MFSENYIAIDPLGQNPLHHFSSVLTSLIYRNDLCFWARDINHWPPAFVVSGTEHISFYRVLFYLHAVRFAVPSKMGWTCTNQFDGNILVYSRPVVSLGCIVQKAIFIVTRGFHGFKRVSHLWHGNPINNTLRTKWYIYEYLITYVSKRVFKISPQIYK